MTGSILNIVIGYGGVRSEKITRNQHVVVVLNLVVVIEGETYHSYYSPKKVRSGVFHRTPVNQGVYPPFPFGGLCCTSGDEADDGS